MKVFERRILALGLALAVTASATVGSVAEAAHAKRSRNQQPVIVEYAEASHGKKIRRRGYRRYRRHRAARHHRYGHLHYNVHRHSQRVFVRPAYSRSFIVYRPRYIVVRPVPVWSYPRYGRRVALRVAARFGGVGLDWYVDERQPLYGCPFDDAYFDDHDDWAEHVTDCRYRGSRRRVIVRSWDDGDIDYFRARARIAYNDEYDR